LSSASSSDLVVLMRVASFDTRCARVNTPSTGGC
jgi:hypothetical protein